MRIRNVSPYGALEVPLLRLVFEAGAEVDVTEDQARRLLPQADNYQPADDEAQAVADEFEQAAAGVPAHGALKAVWVAYAEMHGDADAASKTKEQLIAEHGADEGDPQ